MTKERRYYFYVNDSPTGNKKKKISVRESELTDKQKEMIYNQFLDYFEGLPQYLQSKFIIAVVDNVQKQAAIKNAQLTPSPSQQQDNNTDENKGN